MSQHLPNLTSCIGCSIHHYLAAPARARGRALLAQRRQRILAYIEISFAETELCANGVARTLGMSVRSLHLALAPDGKTFNHLVRQRRLAAVLAMLRVPDRSDSIADIAFACGFNSLSSFYRAFRRDIADRPGRIGTDWKGQDNLLF